MKVKAALGVKVPVEDKPHVYIEQRAVDVDETLYYRRRIDDGDLVIVTTVKQTKSKEVNV